MQTSARNCLSGHISQLTLGAVNAEVEVVLVGGERVVAAITLESVHTLRITEGLPVVALVKAAQIILVTDFAGYRLSARNQLSARVLAIKSSGMYAEVELELRGGQILIATVSHDSVQNLALRKGDSVSAVFKAGAVMLGVGLPAFPDVPSNNTGNPGESL